MRLLRSFLSPDQRLSLLSSGHFHVRGSEGGRFRIRLDRTVNVDELDGDGEETARWCVIGAEGPSNAPPEVEPVATQPPPVPYLPWPVGDVVLEQKLLIESDEPEFRRVAKRSSVTRFDDALSMAWLGFYVLDNPTSTDTWRAIFASAGVEFLGPVTHIAPGEDGQMNGNWTEQTPGYWSEPMCLTNAHPVAVEAA